MNTVSRRCQDTTCQSGSLQGSFSPAYGSVCQARGQSEREWNERGQTLSRPPLRLDDTNDYEQGAGAVSRDRFVLCQLDTTVAQVLE